MRLAAQKHIRGLLISRSADTHLIFVLHKYLTSYNDTFTSMTNSWAAQKQSRPRTILQYITHFASTHMVNYSYIRVLCPKCAYKILQIWVFEFALLNFARNPRKLMCREYFHFYSMLRFVKLNSKMLCWHCMFRVRDQRCVMLHGGSFFHKYFF